jgi:hypothetical protein
MADEPLPRLLVRLRRSKDDAHKLVGWREDGALGCIRMHPHPYCNGGKMEASPLTAKTVPFTSCPSASRRGIITTTE